LGWRGTQHYTYKKEACNINGEDTAGEQLRALAIDSDATRLYFRLLYIRFRTLKYTGGQAGAFIRSAGRSQ